MLNRKPYLIAPADRDDYAAAIFAWLQGTLPLYSAANVRRDGCRYTAADNHPLPFEFVSGEHRICLRPAGPIELLASVQGDYTKARQQVLRLAEGLLQEARPADRKQLQQLRRQEAASNA